MIYVRQAFLFLFATTFLTLSTSGQELKSTLRHPRISEISISATLGHTFRTRSFEAYEITLPANQSIAAEITFRPNRLTLVDSLFGMPFFGVGVYKPFLHRDDILGHPYSIYAIYGTTIAGIGRRISLDFQGTLGISLGWKPYDHIFNPANYSIGAKNDYHAQAFFYLNIVTTPRLNTRLGCVYTHFSDGAYRLPNAGLNLIGIYGAASYSFANQKVSPFAIGIENRRLPQHLEFDTELKISNREVKQLASNSNRVGIVHSSFQSITATGFMMYSQSIHARIGIGVQLIYDESSNITTYQNIDSLSTNSYYYTFKPSKIGNRFGAAVYARGELPMGYINGAADLGYIFNNNAFQSDVFAVNLSVKSYVYRSAYLIFGVQTIPTRKSNCTYFGLGYSFKKVVF